MTQKKEWYNRKFLVIFLLGTVFPMGLYALWKSDTIVEKKWWKVAISIFVIVVAISTIATDDESSPTFTPSKSRVSALTEVQKDSIAEIERAVLLEKRREKTVLAIDLVRAYEENEVASDQDFKGEKFYVEGYIEDIGKDILDNIYVTLKSNELFRSVQCYLDDGGKVAKLHKGQKITVFGRCDGLMMNVLMNNCELVDNIETL